MISKVFLVGISCFGYLNLNAQQIQLIGTVKDDQGNGLLGATVLLTTGTPDKKNVALAIADIDGNFMLASEEKGDYILQVSFVGFETYEAELSLLQNFKIGGIHLKEVAQKLNEVEIEARAPVALIKGDTVQYRAASFKVNPDANAEDLILKMPGIMESNGSIKAQGEDVQKVLVDGKEFFGNDPNIALKNLPAEVIDKIEIFDQLSEESQLTGFDDGETIKTINIVTKIETRNGTFGKVYVGSGTDGKYSLGGNINLFNGDKRISILGITNNINQQNFTTEDLGGVLSGAAQGGRGGRQRGRGQAQGGNFGGGSSRFSAGGNANNFLIGNQSGISKISSTGINYNDNWGNKWKISGSYFYNQSDNINESVLTQQFFLLGDNQLYGENSITESFNYNQRLNARLTFDMNENNSFIFTPSVSLQNTEYSTSLIADNYLLSNEQLNEINNVQSGDNLSLVLSNQILWRHKFNKIGRTLSARGQFSMTESNGDYLLFGFTNSSGIVDSTDQVTKNDYLQQSFSGGLNYTEPLGKKSQLILSYGLSSSKGETDNKTNSLEINGLFELDTALTAIQTNNYLTHTSGVGYQYRAGRDLLFTTKVNYQYAQLDNDLTLPFSETTSQGFQSLLPMAQIRYKISQDANLRIFYRTRTSQPPASQLQSSIDNTNPLQLITGNPDLKQNYSHTLVSRYNKTNVTNATSMFAMLYLNYTKNYIGNSSLVATEDTILDDRTILERGVQLSSPVNLNKYWNVRSFFNYSLRVGFVSSKLNFNTGLNFTQTPGVVNGVTNQARSVELSQVIVLASNISPAVDFTLSHNFSYNIVKNDIQEELDQNYTTQSTGLKFNWIFGNGIVLNNQAILKRYNGFADGLNQDITLWNISLGKKIMKDNSGEISLKVYDLLNQNNSITRTVTESYIEDVETKILQQYFMLSFLYTIRNFQS